MKRKAQRPMEGIYYFVPSGSTWDLSYEYSEEGIDLKHDEFWENTVAPELASIYKLNKKQLEDLKLVPYGLPRGRVQSPGGHGYEGTGWIVWNGGDTPAGGKEKILDKFNLNVINKGGKVLFQFDSHETIQLLHREVVRNLLFKKGWRNAIDANS